MDQLCSHTDQPLQPLGKSANGFAISNEGLVYSLDAHSVSYEDDYFFTDYENQYGKSYQNDEVNLRRLAKNRLERLNRIIQNDTLNKNENRKYRLLEIGSATGFFIDEANKAGFESIGIEVSGWACNKAKEMGLNVIHSSFLEFDQNTTKQNHTKENTKLNSKPGLESNNHSETKDSFDVIAAFYVIEHFAEQNIIFNKIKQYLRPGGYFIFALPSTYGPLFRCNLPKWIATHPTDHYVDYSPLALKKILPLYQMKAIHFRPASYHQERSCGILKRIPNFLYRAYANLTSYGDTIEVIAKRI